MCLKWRKNNPLLQTRKRYMAKESDLSILVLKIAFTLIKTNNKIQSLNIFNRNFLYTVDVNDATFL